SALMPCRRPCAPWISAEIHGAHGLLQGISADVWIIGSKGAIAEYGMEEERYSRHGHNDVVFFAGLLEVAHNLVMFRRSRVNWNQVVVVQVDAPRAYFSEQIDKLRRGEQGTDEVAEGITSAIADGPQSESKFMLRAWLIFIVAVAHFQSPSMARWGAMS